MENRSLVSCPPGGSNPPVGSEESSLLRETKRHGVEGETACMVYADWLDDAWRAEEAVRWREKGAKRAERRVRRAEEREKKWIVRAQWAELRRVQQEAWRAMMDVNIVFNKMVETRFEFPSAQARDEFIAQRYAVVAKEREINNLVAAFRVQNKKWIK